MRIFVTGGTGYIGAAVVAELVRAGHDVTGLARAGRTSSLLDLGATALEGTLQQPEAWVARAAAHEAVIHMAIDYTAPPAVEAALLRQLLAALAAAGEPRALLYTSGVWVLGATGATPATETASTAHAAAAVAWRPRHEQMVLRAAGGQVATAVLRPGMVYGGKAGLMTPFFSQTQEQGAPSIVGDGRNHWSVVHREDLARLYRMVLEQRATGIFHGVDEHPRTVEAMAALASRAVGGDGSVRTVPVEAARNLFGAMADALCLDQRILSPRARAMGWEPAYRSYEEGVASAAEQWRA